MGTCMLGVRSAMFAVSWEVGVKPLTIFACWGVSGDSAGHAAEGLYVISRHRQKEVFGWSAANAGLEHPLLPAYWEPVAAFVRLGER